MVPARCAKSCLREHHFYNRFSRGATLVDDIYKNASNHQHRIIISLAIRILHEHVPGKNESFERILEPQHD